MKLFNKLLTTTLFAGAVFTANSQTLGEGRVVNLFAPSGYQTFLQAITLVYETKEQISITDSQIKCNVNIAGKSYEVYPEIYFDYDLALDLGQTFFNNAWGNQLIIDFSEEAFEDGHPVGKYVIEIPEGLVKSQNGATNAKQVLNFIKVDTTEPVSVSPANGQHPANDLKNIEITFDKTVKHNAESSPIEIREYNDWISTPTYLEEYKISENGKTLTFDLSFLTRGVNYSILVPEGFLVTDDYYTNADIWMEYMNWDGMPQATIISAPEAESTPKVNPFILTWDYQPIALSPNAPDTEFICGFPDYGIQKGKRIWIPADSYTLVSVDKEGNVNMTPGTGQANAVYLDVTEFTKDYLGYDFEINIPAGLVLNGEGLDNPPLHYSFAVRNLWNDPTVTAENGVLTLAWPFAPWVQYNLGDDEVTMVGSNGSEYVLEYTFGGSVPGQVSVINEGNIHGLQIDLNNLNLQNASYTLTVPRGYINLMDLIDNELYVLNDMFEYTFTWENGNIAGIESIISNEGVNIIHDLQGRKINSTDLTRLPKGIYIINGKKVIL